MSKSYDKTLWEMWKAVGHDLPEPKDPEPVKGVGFWSSASNITGMTVSTGTWNYGPWFWHWDWFDEEEWWESEPKEPADIAALLSYYD